MSVSRTRSKAFWIFTLLLVFVAVADQWSKHLAHEGLSPSYPFVVTSFLNLVVVYNRGAAFGFLNSQDGWQIIVFSLIALVVLVYLVYHIWKDAYQSLLVVSAYGFIAGGAIGNLVDRIRFGFVVDFIDFHWDGWHFWTFNLADAALTLGVFLLIIAAWQDHKAARSNAPRETP